MTNAEEMAMKTDIATMAVASEKEVLTMTEYIENPLSGKLRGVTYEDGKVTDVHIMDTDDVVKVFVPIRHGRWILEAHDERVNYRWNVTAECSECCDEQKEIWAGFFPNVPPSIARDVALVSAESVKLSNYCPNCGAIMDGGTN